jgi:hypothetical protein
MSQRGIVAVRKYPYVCMKERRITTKNLCQNRQPSIEIQAEYLPNNSTINYDCIPLHSIYGFSTNKCRKLFLPLKV